MAFQRKAPRSHVPDNTCYYRQLDFGLDYGEEFLKSRFFALYTIWGGGCTISGGGLRSLKQILLCQLAIPGRDSAETDIRGKSYCRLFSNSGLSELVNKDQRVFFGVLVIVFPAGQWLKTQGAVEFRRRQIRLPDLKKDPVGSGIGQSSEGFVEERPPNAPAPVRGRNRDIPKLGFCVHAVESRKSHDFRQHAVLTLGQQEQSSAIPGQLLVVVRPPGDNSLAGILDLQDGIQVIV
jgi:hypothetical protein